MLKRETQLRAIAALKAQGDLVSAALLEEDLKITGFCQYCEKRLQTSFELITLLDTCEECQLVEDVHPAKLKRMLPRMLAAYDETLRIAD